MIELSGGITAMAAFLKWGLTPEALFGILILLGFLAIALIDLDTFVISDPICIVIALLGVGLLTASGQTSRVPKHLIAGMVGGCFVLTIILLSRGGMGFGDVKLAATMGIILGLRDLGVALFLGIVLGAAAALLLLLTRRKGRGDAMPFGPFLAAGAIVTMLQGDAVVDFYEQLVGLR